MSENNEQLLDGNLSTRNGVCGQCGDFGTVVHFDPRELNGRTPPRDLCLNHFAIAMATMGANQVQQELMMAGLQQVMGNMFAQGREVTDETEGSVEHIGAYL